MMEADIVVILKPEKDPALFSFYRPISLLNTDIKILAKVLATRLMEVAPSLMYNKQTDFMPGKGMDLNIWHLFTNIAATISSGEPWVVFSLDAEKSIDSVELSVGSVL